MAKLHPDEREALRAFSQVQALPRQLTPLIPFSDYLRYLSQLPPSLCPPKAVRFTGKFWKL